MILLQIVLQYLIMNSNPSINDLLACAVSAAKAAGNYALKNKSRRSEVILSAAHDVKLKLDVECQQIAEEVILSAFPLHNILGEEDSSPSLSHHSNTPILQYPHTSPSAHPPSSDICHLPSVVCPPPSSLSYLWILDPIDGTVNFHHGFPFWCCSLAIEQEGQIIAGVIYAPELNELYTATSQQRSMLNGKPISVSATRKLQESIIMTGIDKNSGLSSTASGSTAESKRKPYEIVTRLASSSRKIRVLGSAALDLCQVASGRADGYFESGIYLWDVAAGDIIVRQAGGKTEFIERQTEADGIAFMASNGLIHDDLKTLITKP